MSDHDQTSVTDQKFDLSATPPNILIHDRRTGEDRRRDDFDPAEPAANTPDIAGERRTKKDRRKRIDPTTFEKQYSDEEMEFMTAMQRYKVQSGKPFPSHGEVLKVASKLGYRKLVEDDETPISDSQEEESNESSPPGHPASADADHSNNT